MQYETLNHYIDGKWVQPTSGQSQEVMNPAKNTALATLGYAGRPDLDKAIKAAETGFRRPGARFRRSNARASCAKRPNLVRDRADDIARVLTLEQGKVLAEAKMEVMSGADVIDWFAEEGKRAYGRIIPARADGVRNMVIQEPVGVVAGFAPWNFPVTQAVRKIAASLAAGCSIILKCPEETPGSPIGLVRCFHDAGVPRGRAQPRLRRAEGHLRVPDPASGDPQDLVHRLGAGRQAPRLPRRPAHEARDDGARRPCARADLRRRRHR